MNYPTYRISRYQPSSYPYCFSSPFRTNPYRITKREPIWTLVCIGVVVATKLYSAHVMTPRWALVATLGVAVVSGITRSIVSASRTVVVFADRDDVNREFCRAAKSIRDRPWRIRHPWHDMNTRNDLAQRWLDARDGDLATADFVAYVTKLRDDISLRKRRDFERRENLVKTVSSWRASVEERHEQRAIQRIRRTKSS